MDLIREISAAAAAKAAAEAEAQRVEADTPEFIWGKTIRSDAEPEASDGEQQ